MRRQTIALTQRVLPSSQFLFGVHWTPLTTHAHADTPTTHSPCELSAKRTRVEDPPAPPETPCSTQSLARRLGFGGADDYALLRAK